MRNLNGERKARSPENAAQVRNNQFRMALDNGIRKAIVHAQDKGVSKADILTILTDWQERAASWVREEQMRQAEQ